MKKHIVLVLMLICTLCLSGCTNRKKQSFDVGDSYSDIEGLSVEVAALYKYPDKTTLSVSWSNKSDFTITYGNMYWIERLENGEWVDCSLKDNIFTLIGYLLNPNETINKEYILTDMYDISKTGTYRFLSTCHLDTGDQKDYTVWAEFIIE